MMPNPFGYHFHNAHLAKLDQSPEVIEKILAWVNSARGIFYFCGNVGTGKTYFAAALWNYLMEKKQPNRTYTEREYFSEIKKVIAQDWDYGSEIKRLCETKWFIIDDLGTSQMTEWQKEVLFTTVDLRCCSGLPTLITSNLSLNEVEEVFGKRMYSRLRSVKNIVIELNGEDRRQLSYD